MPMKTPLWTPSAQPETEDRKIKFGKQFNSANQIRPFVGNAITTTKYTVGTFLPLNLWEQMHKFGNVYFLSISVLMYLGEKTTLFIGTIKAFSTLATLLMMMAVTAFMAALDDKRRNDSDKEVNGKSTSTASPSSGKSSKKTWEQVAVGDFLIVEKDEEIPADFVLFYSSGDAGNCYVSTANLDGETNLKLKTAPPSTQVALATGGKSKDDILPGLSSIGGTVTAEAPKTSIHDFNGYMEVDAKSEILGPKQLLLRGTILKNTAWCVGLVVYTGKETRMVMNAAPAPLKQSNLEVITNKLMILVLIFQCGLALASDVVYIFVKDSFHKYWYLSPPDLLLPDAVAYFLTFVVLYSNMMPISLYPTMEVCNYAQAYFIKNDKRMFCKELKFPAGVKAMNLCQEVGQVCYVFSDKTGTLTQNVMELKCIFIPDHEVYGKLTKGEKGFSGKADIARALQDDSKKEAVCNFLEILAVSHTVMVTVSTDARGETRYSYEAESPDEGALVESAGDLGHRFVGRVGQDATLEVNGRRETYTVLITNEFNSTRKRMSVVVKKHGAPEGKEYLLLVKGADNVMLERAAAKPLGIENQLLNFSRQGLRTLVLGRKELRKEDVDKWLADIDVASKDMSNRDQLLDQVAEDIEKGFTVAGATAIEDKLQDEVCETIAMIREAGVKLWVLTGDKLETAKEIGFSSNVLSLEMNIHTLDLGDESQHGADNNWFVQLDRSQANESEMSKFVDKLKATPIEQQSALMVTGAALEAVMSESTLKDKMLEAAECLRVVIACRVSPLQKAQMVRLVREGKSTDGKKSCLKSMKGLFSLELPPVTLAIGDGANDVPMIQEAQVGVGIAGREGRQAVNNSDFAIGQFKYLQRLLFVHGRWNYRRQCKFTKFTFWRNAVQVLMIVYYNGMSGFSGTSLFEDWIRLSFNFLCSLPIMATGCFDRDLKEAVVLKNPGVYSVGKDALDLNSKKMVLTFGSAFLHSLVLFWLTYLAFPSMDIQGAGDYYTFGTAVYTFLICDMNYRVLFISSTHNHYTVGSILVSFALYGVFLIVYPSNKLLSNALAPNMYMVPYHMCSNLTFWFCLLAVPAVAMHFDIFLSYLWLYIDDTAHRLYSLVQAHEKDEAPPSARDEGAKTRYRPVDTQEPEDRCSDGQQPSEIALLSPATTEAESRESEYDELSKYIDMSKFAQQEDTKGNFYEQFPQFLANPWKFVMLWNVAICFLLSFFGAVALYSSQEASQLRIHYDGHRAYKTANATDIWTWNSIHPWGTKDDEIEDVRSQCSMPAHTSCRIKVKVPHNMNSPILVLYTLGPFYQNYNDYLKSEVSKELRGQHVSTSIRHQYCKQDKTRINASGYHIYPCGMKATSFFNDTFRVTGHEIDEHSLAWKVDLDRYANPPDYPKGPWEKTSWLYERYPGVIPEDEGVRNEHFAAWMRPSAASRVWNSYGYLHDDLKKGDELEIEIDNNFPMHTIPGGWKSLVFTEVGSLGARHDGFAYLLFFCAMCAALSVLCAFCRRNPAL